jgi:hypothetical protein
MLSDNPESRVFKIDDGYSVPLTVIVDEDGLHLSQEDYQDMTDEVTASWDQVMGLLDILNNLESYFNVRH